jgi:hypothetical protein
MATEGTHIDRGDTQERGRRYASLRSAVRALSPALSPEKSLELQERVQELSGRIRLATSPETEGSKQEPEVALLAALESVDRELDEFHGELLSLVSDLPLSQVRATLPPVQEKNPDEVLALLEVCTGDDRGIMQRLSLLDYVITLASAETDAGRKRVALDPATLTPGVEALCEKANRYPTDEVVELVREFHSVREKVERGEPLGPLRKRARQVKRVAQARLLAQEVLRAAVACNVALWNRLEELTEVDRTLESAEFHGMEALGGAGQTIASVEPGHADSVLDAEGIEALGAAIRTRLEGFEPADGAASRLVDRLEIGRLSHSEERAFTEWQDDHTGRAVRSAVVVGLIARQIDGISQDLREAGVDAKTLREAWIPELASELLIAAQTCLTDHPDSGAAQSVAEVRTKLLRVAAEKGLWSEEGLTDEAGSTAAHGRSAKRRQKEQGRSARESSIPTWPLAAAACLLALAVVGYLQVTANPNVDLYSSSRLSEVSPYLESAYQTDSGRGPLLVGTLNEEWERLSGVERAAIGRKIGEHLGLEGVPEVMLFDAERNLEVHYADEKLRHVARPD